MIEIFRGSQFKANRAWTGINIDRLQQADLKLRWTDQPFRWHANRGKELFAVLHGSVSMSVRVPGQAEEGVELVAGDMMYIHPGVEHCAFPHGEATLLVVEEPEQ